MQISNEEIELDSNSTYENNVYLSAPASQTLSNNSTNISVDNTLSDLHSELSEHETDSIPSRSNTSSLTKVSKNPDNNNIIALCTNSDSLLNKKHELLLEAISTEANILLVTEVRPKYFFDPLTEDDFTIPGFILYSNIEETENRGVAIYISEDLNPLVTKVYLSNSFEEQVWIKLGLKGNDSLLVGCIYRSGASTINNNKELCKLMKLVCELNPTHIFTYGDFNFKGINWNTMEGSTLEEKKFVQAIQDSFLYQHVEKTTRIRIGQQSNLLDLVLSREEGMVKNIDYLPPLGASDHLCLKVDINLYAEKPKVEARYQYHKGDYSQMNDDLRKEKWHELMEGKSAEDSFLLFSKIFDQIMKGNIPKQTSKFMKRKRLWINRKAFKQRKKKINTFKHFRNKLTDIEHQAARREANALSHLTDKLRRSFEKDLAKNAKKNPKGFWRYYQSLTKTRSDIGDILKKDGSIASNNKDKAEALNNFFTSVFTHENLGTVPSLDDKNFDCPLSSVIITPEKVYKKLKKLKKNKSAGPDGFHPRILWECAETIKVPLALIFNKSLNEAKLPSDWKLGNIKALYKQKGKRNNPGNYRPISLTSVIGKIMEAIIKDEIVEHFMRNNFFCDEQHGFVPGRNCITQLLCCLEEWTSLLDAGYPVDILYLDFRKAFDTVPHRRLLEKLKSYGIRGRLFRWLENFLQGRKQRVVVGDQMSDWSEVKSGIPQGSVLGPILFAIFINDIPDGVKSLVKIFADDTKQYRAIRDVNDNVTLQDDINSVHKWSEVWQLGFNLDKCVTLPLGFKNKKHKYNIDGNIVETVVEEKDLGIIVDVKLNFHKHILTATKKANSILGCIRRAIKFKDRDMILPLYKAHVRSRLEYGSVIWSPYLVQDKKRIEYVQRRATKMINGIRHLDYKQRLIELNLPSLEYRRRYADMVQVYKILCKLERIEREWFFAFSNSRTRGHNKKFYKPRARLNIRKNSFSHRVIEDWNSLPHKVVNAEDLEEFKAGLTEFWMEEKFSNPFDN